ncbi:TetR family transcriptional regulator [Actinomadura sp. HBU206391]|uniref:TetR family transcriptional regulator n=1 Tax=Actinomadura sp. HBU206391 TaxID=2731692 RepID=UPI0016501FA6|nr:TetR family transcriptional regulator [Actinomadura sp. HBU206391]MBC6463609.1 TetR/AcrR family transcriptional regulator [Actinomadura sp. HBU206391]
MGAGRERSLRDELLEAAAELLARRGYKRLRMQDVADAVGVSRQTVYNEFSDKWGLAQAVVLRDNDAYLDGVDDALSRHEDLCSAVAAAVTYTLKTASDDPLKKAILTGADGGDLLPLFTTQADPLLFAARARIIDHAVSQWPGLDRDTVAEIADAAVRLTLSHVVLPAEPPETVARLIARIVTRYLGEPAP